MPSLFESLSNLANEISDKTSFVSGNFAEKLAFYRDTAVNNFTRSNIDLNESIAKIAKDNSLNDDQIQRIVEDANTQVYLLKYAEMKRYPQREVMFPIAKVASVKDIVANGVKKNEPVIEKKASWEDGKEDKLNFLNYSSNKSVGLAPEKSKGICEIVAEKLAHDLSEVEESICEKKASFAANVYNIAEALIKYDRSNVNAQNVFSLVCKEASLRINDQRIIKTAVDQKCSQMKEYRIVPEEYNFTIDLVDIEKEADDFSLGKYSLAKCASAVPVIITDDGKIIRQISDLVNMVKDVNNQKNDIKAVETKKEDLLSKVQKNRGSSYGKNIV